MFHNAHTKTPKPTSHSHKPKCVALLTDIHLVWSFRILIPLTCCWYLKKNFNPNNKKTAPMKPEP